MFFKFIKYNLIFQIFLSVVFISNIVVFDLNQFTSYAMIIFFIITVLVNIPFYFMINWFEYNYRVKK